MLGNRGGANLLKLTGAWKRSPHPVEPDPVRYWAECNKCHTVVFGYSKMELNARKERHNCGM